MPFMMLLTMFIVGCKNDAKKIKEPQVLEKDTITAQDNIEDEIDPSVLDSLITNPPEGMVWIPAGTFMQGAVPQDNMAMAHEKPQHPVAVDGFFMDATEVTNARFKTFVDTTGYVTIAEREIDWEEMKKQLPAGTPKPHDSVLQPGSLMFKKKLRFRISMIFRSGGNGLLV